MEYYAKKDQTDTTLNIHYQGSQDPRDAAQEESFASGMLNSMQSFLTTLVKADAKKGPLRESMQSETALRLEAEEMPQGLSKINKLPAQSQKKDVKTISQNRIFQGRLMRGNGNGKRQLAGRLFTIESEGNLGTGI